MWHIQIIPWFLWFPEKFLFNESKPAGSFILCSKTTSILNGLVVKFLWDSCGIKISETNNTSFDFVGMNNHTFLERLECMSNKLLNSKKRRMFQICVVEKDWLLERNIINRLRHNTIMFCPHLNYNTIVPTLARLLLLLTTS